MQTFAIGICKNGGISHSIKYFKINITLPTELADCKHALMENLTVEKPNPDFAFRNKQWTQGHTTLTSPSLSAQ